MIDWRTKGSLKRVLKDHQISQAELVKASGVSRPQLWRIIEGHCEPRFGTQTKIESALFRLLPQEVAQ